MKTLFSLLTIVLLMNANAFAQGIKRTEPQEFWETNIQAIISGDVDQVVKQSYFPMSTFEGDWSEEDFIDAFDILFDESTIAALPSMTYRDIQTPDEGSRNLEYILVVSTSTEIDGELYESALILSFSKIEGEWMLYHIDMAG